MLSLLSIISSVLQQAAALQDESTRGRQTHRESWLHAGSHARLARFTGNGLWASGARDLITPPVSWCRRGRGANFTPPPYARMSVWRVAVRTFMDRLSTAVNKRTDSDSPNRDPGEIRLKKKKK